MGSIAVGLLQLFRCPTLLTSWPSLHLSYFTSKHKIYHLRVFSFHFKTKIKTRFGDFKNCTRNKSSKFYTRSICKLTISSTLEVCLFSHADLSHFSHDSRHLSCRARGVAKDTGQYGNLSLPRNSNHEGSKNCHKRLRMAPFTCKLRLVTCK